MRIKFKVSVLAASMLLLQGDLPAALGIWHVFSKSKQSFDKDLFADYKVTTIRPAPRIAPLKNEKYEYGKRRPGRRGYGVPDTNDNTIEEEPDGALSTDPQSARSK